MSGDVISWRHASHPSSPGVRASASARPQIAALVGAILFPVAIVVAVGTAAVHHVELPWDAGAVRFAEGHYHSAIVNPLATALAVSLAVGVAVTACAVLLLLAGGRRRRALFWAAAIGGVLALDVPLKTLFGRTAFGGEAGSNSFPSGNAMVSAAILTSCVLTCSTQWRRRVVIAGLPLLVVYGAALVYGWWHYPSDVLGGWCTAVAWVSGLWFLLHPGRRAEPRMTYFAHHGPGPSQAGGS